jgi:hypothetical protein
MPTRSAKAPRKTRKKERHARMSPETVTDLVTGKPIRLTTTLARRRDHRVRMFRRKLLRAAPAINDEKFAPVTLSFCRISILSMDAYRFLHQCGIAGADGELRKSVDTYARLVNTQLKLAEKLGLTPAAFRSIKDEAPFDLVAEIARTRSHTETGTENAEVVSNGLEDCEGPKSN